VTCFPVGRKSRPRSTKQANRALRPKNDSLRSPTTNRQPGGDIAAWGKPQNCGPQSLLQSVDGVFAFTWGRCPQTPGIYRLGATMARLHVGRSQHHCPPIGRPRSMRGGTGNARPTIAAAESALRSHPCGALSSAQLRSISPKHIEPSRNIQ
jgi:hypothetical protein